MELSIPPIRLATSECTEADVSTLITSSVEKFDLICSCIDSVLRRNGNGWCKELWRKPLPILDSTTGICVRMVITFDLQLRALVVELM
jgi:hypothetical protein